MKVWTWITLIGGGVVLVVGLLTVLSGEGSGWSRVLMGLALILGGLAAARRK